MIMIGNIICSNWCYSKFIFSYEVPYCKFYQQNLHITPAKVGGEITR